MKKRVLVCGASGFIGRNLFEHFSRKEGLVVYGTYLNNEQLNKRNPHPHLWRVDLTNKEHVDAIVSQGFDYVLLGKLNITEWAKLPANELEGYFDLIYEYEHLKLYRIK